MNALESILKQFEPDTTGFPAVWGEGALFAYSGMEGQTNTISQFVATLAPKPFSLLIHTPARRSLDITGLGTCQMHIVTNDVIAAETPQGIGITTYTSWHTIVGCFPPGSQIALSFTDSDPVNSNQPYEHPSYEHPSDAGCWITWDSTQQDSVVLCVRHPYWSLAYGATVNEATMRAKSPLNAQNPLDDVILPTARKHLGLFNRLPQLPSPADRTLLYKCFSVMKANTLSPEGVNASHWSTPDRVPHRHMWLWDSVFHAFGMNHFDPGLAREFLTAVLDRQRDDGMIPHIMCADGTTSAITQPPLLAWGVWDNYQNLQDKSTLAYALPKLESYLLWNTAHRDSHGNGLLEWRIEGNPMSRSGESGMDNSQRFDGAVQLDAVDFNTYQALDMVYTARIADSLGYHNRALQWQTRAAQLSQRIHANLWDECEGFYFDRTIAGEFSPVKAVSGFLPLLLDDIDERRVEALVRQLNNPQTFNSAFPIPSVSLDTPDWSTNMWRGATWINMNFMVIAGLRKHGQMAQAGTLRDKTLHFVDKYYRQYGVIFEFYDARDAVPPVACDRKGPCDCKGPCNFKGHRKTPYNIRVKIDSIRDYHWSAALVAKLLWRDE
ncbi:MAG: trehalase family glycosidase [Anaerolineae bacterium]|nr:trehalase family glycosidase [Anaerolineae bacterium]